MSPSLVLPSFLCSALYLSSALSFSVSVRSSPSQCGPLNVTWKGGQPPFQISLIPVYDTPRNISVPSTAFNYNHGAYQIPFIPFLNGTDFLLSMSDATGFATGGTSDLLTVGAPVGSTSCNTSGPPLSFSFGLPSSLEQCSPYTFDDYDRAILPVTIAGYVPGGESFLLHPPPSGTSYTWVADVAAGTTIIFTLTDAKGNSGGTSYTEIVALSNDVSCLNANSPSSTASSVPSSTSSAASSPVQLSSSLSTKTIVGVAVGVVLAVAAIVMLAVFYLRRQYYRRTPFGVAPTRESHHPSSIELDPSIDNFQHPSLIPFPYQTDSTSHLALQNISGLSTLASHRGTSLRDPSVHASETTHVFQGHTRESSNVDSLAPFGDVPSSTMSSNGRRKAVMAGMSSYQPATRFIVHTDAEDNIPADEAEVIELPPQYSERRTPVRSSGEQPMSSAMGPLPADGHVAEPSHVISHPPE